MSQQHNHGSPATSIFAPSNDLIRVGSRRWFLQMGVGGLAGLSVPQLLQLQAQAGQTSRKKSVILFWLSGGPSQLEMWDPKPDAPKEVRGPFNTITTKLPGVRFGEHLPKQASIADKLSIFRAIDCSASNHTPITMQAGNPLARRTNDGRDGGGYPSMGSVVAKFKGANDPDMPAFVGLARSWRSDVWEAGDMGASYAPVKGLSLAGKFARPKGVTIDQLQDRDSLRKKLDTLRQNVDRTNTMERFDRYTQRAYDMVLSGKVQEAFNVGKEPAKLREAYGRDSIGQKAILARRLVESGVSFVLVSGAWGYFDHHGDDVRWGGIEKGLKPLMPRVDRVIHALVNDLEERGILDDTLVMMMGEFGRTPKINNKAGRHHWTPVMSMIMAGGGLKHGQVIGSSDDRAGAIRSGRVRPQDIAATTFQHLGIDLNSHWVNSRGRPIPIVTSGGHPIRELG